MAEPSRRSRLSDEERAELHRQLEPRRAEIEAMRPLDAGERDLLRAALPARRWDTQQDGAA